MSRIVITENQYKRLFLGEQNYPEQNCKYMLSNNWRSNEHDIPFYFTLQDPFGDGYDYQYKVWDNCSRTWIRRKKSFRKNGVKSFHNDSDVDWKVSDAEKSKLFKKKTEFYNSLISSREEMDTPENVKKDIDRNVATMKSNGWTIKRYGGTSPTRKDLYLTNHMSALYTIKDIVTNGERWNPRFDAEQGGQSCLTVKTSTIGTYSYDNAKKYKNKISNVTKLSGRVGGGELPYYEYEDEDGLPRREYKTIENVPGNTYFLHDFYYINKGKIWGDYKMIGTDSQNVYKTPLFPDGIFSFIEGWFGTSNMKQFKSDSNNASEPYCSNGNLTFVGTKATADVSIHDVLQVAAAFAWFIPGLQPAALALEAVDAGIYFYEGDTFGGILGLAFVLIPGGMPIVRRLNRSGIKKVEKFVLNTEKHIKSNPNLTKKELGTYITKQKKLGKLTTEETKAVDEILINTKKINSELTKLSKLSKTQRVKLLSEKSKEFEKLWGKNVGWGKESKYWERQIDMKMWERLIIPTTFIGAVMYRNMSVDDAVMEFNDSGFENINSNDVEVMVKDLDGLKETLKKYSGEDLKVIPDDTKKTQLIDDIFKIVTIVNVVGVESDIYKENVKPNIRDSKTLHDIYNTIVIDEQLKDVDYRNLSEDVDYKWYKTLGCEKDPYSTTQKDIENEDSLKSDDIQNKIDSEGEILILRGDSKYEYRLYGGYWFWKLKDGVNNWKVLKNCLGCSKLQRSYNEEIEDWENLSKFDYDNELNKELDKKK